MNATESRVLNLEKCYGILEVERRRFLEVFSRIQRPFRLNLIFYDQTFTGT